MFRSRLRKSIYNTEIIACAYMNAQSVGFVINGVGINYSSLHYTLILSFTQCASAENIDRGNEFSH